MKKQAYFNASKAVFGLHRGGNPDKALLRRITGSTDAARAMGVALTAESLEKRKEAMVNAMTQPDNRLTLPILHAVVLHLARGGADTAQISYIFDVYSNGRIKLDFVDGMGGDQALGTVMVDGETTTVMMPPPPEGDNGGDDTGSGDSGGVGTGGGKKEGGDPKNEGGDPKNEGGDPKNEGGAPTNEGGDPKEPFNLWDMIDRVIDKAGQIAAIGAIVGAGLGSSAGPGGSAAGAAEGAKWGAGVGALYGGVTYLAGARGVIPLPDGRGDWRGWPGV